jgi:hypothetical protein
VAGRRAGKSRFAGALAVRAGIRRYKLAPGERATVAIAAADRDQARVLLGYAVAPFEEREELRSRVQKRSVLERLSVLVTRRTRWGVDLVGDVSLQVHPSNFGTIRGRTFALALADEWRSGVPRARQTRAVRCPQRSALGWSPSAGSSSAFRRPSRRRGRYGRPSNTEGSLLAKYPPAFFGVTRSLWRDGERSACAGSDERTAAMKSVIAIGLWSTAETPSALAAFNARPLPDMAMMPTSAPTS